MKPSILFLLLATLMAALGTQRESFDASWKFARFGDMPDGTKLAETATPAPDFDDSKWRTVNLPHDWGIEGPFRADLPNSTGKLPWVGIGWYRKTLDLPAADQGKVIYLDFDGAMSQPKIFVNGQLAGEWAYGYSSFRIDITPFVKFGAPNTIAVRLDNPADSSRWYPGGGIYRHVWLVKANPIHIAYNGIFARSENITADSADVVVSAQLDIQGPISGQRLDIIHELLDASGKIVTSGKSIDAEPARFNVKSPTLWSIEKPYLYTLRTTLVRGDQKLDTVDTPIGIRSAEWKTDGFYLNGKRVQIKGVCNHHDLGALGSAFNTRAAERQLEILKDMGCNSIRTSHNPPAPQLLDLCDRMGILVLDELFDSWKLSKNKNDYHVFYDQWHERDIANFVRRDRNHPSVIAWSIGNELPEQKNKDFWWVPENLTKLFRSHDPTRQVTLGINHLSSAASPYADTVDITGLNYPVKDKNIIAKVRDWKKDVPILTSESSSCVSSRGCYFFPVKWDKGSGFRGFHVSSYELYAPGWANRPDLDFELLEKNPFVAGEYVWTGFDYLGEPTPFNVDETNALNFDNEEQRRKAMEEFQKLGGKSPSRSSYFGIIDLAGFPKDRYYIYQAHWRPDFPMAHILPHWNWPERVGQVTPVHVFTSGDEAELFLNGKSLGRKKKEEFQYRIVWEDVVYQPGTLTVKTWKNGKAWAEADRSTTGKASQLLVKADRPEIKADGKDLSYITITIADEKKRLVPGSMNRLKFKISGDAEIAGICNGDPTSLESMQGDTLPAFNGLCQVILRGKSGKPGKATLHVESEGLPAGKVTITTR
jgi:beta-galactosidase